METGRQRRYLEAMGIRVWRLRAFAAVPEAAAAEPPPPLPVPPVAVAPDPEPPAPPSPPSPPPLEASDPVAALDWEALRQAAATCRACSLGASRTRSVFGVGDPGAALMIVGEAPGAEEDRQGEPFVGRAGQLLNRMLAAIGYCREQVYIANILKCRPPGNRNPRPDEAAACRAFLLRQIALVEPRLILAAGAVAAHNLLETEDAVGRLRGRWFTFGPRSVPVLVTYHPSYLLRAPEQKAKAWEDLQQALRRLREAP